MILVDYKDEFKSNFNWKEKITVGKTDKNQEKIITFYNSKRTKNNVGFKESKTTKIKPITILLRYGKNQREAEIMANKIQDFYDKRSFNTKEAQIYSILMYQEPIYLGTDDNNIYEYSFEIDFIENIMK